MKVKEASLKLARSAVETYLKRGRTISPAGRLPQQLLKGRAGVFVSLHTKSGRLCGCVGTYRPTRESLAAEIIHNAIAAATQDPRFSPIRLSELPNLLFSIDILSKLQPLNDPNDLAAHRPDTHGVLVRSKNDRRAGLLLPGLDGIESPEKQLLIACQKAGIDRQTELNNCRLYSFTVKRYEEQ